MNVHYLEMAEKNTPPLLCTKVETKKAVKIEADARAFLDILRIRLVKSRRL